MTPDELRALADAATPGPWELCGETCWCGQVFSGDTLVADVGGGEPVDENAMLTADARLVALAPVLARDHAALLKQRDEDRAWMKRAADVLRAMLSTLADYPTVEEMNETRFADLRGYMVDAETDLLATLLAEFDVLRERP